MSEGSEQSPTQLVRREYERRISKIADLPELEMRSSSVRRVLTGLAPEVALVWMDQIIRGAIWGRTDDLQVAVALAHWLINRDGGDEQYTFFEQIYRSAHEAEVDGVLYVLRNAPPHQEMRPEAELPEVRLPMDRDPDEIPIGERRTLARRADVDVLKRLALDPSPLVIRNLLSNPDLTEEEVLRIASRRPTDPAILSEVSSHLRWFRRTEVRKALVHNPYHWTGDSLTLLPTVGLHALRRIGHGTDLHPLLTEAAEYFVDMRETHTSPWEV